MISYIKGTLAQITEDCAVVETGGLGFSVFVSSFTAQAMPSVGSEVKLHTFLYVKEDILALYGFLHKDELELFLMLLKVSGIGPKGALSVLSGMPAGDLRIAIISQDAKGIARKSSGIGLKTAQKLILELKDKIDYTPFGQDESAQETLPLMPSGAKSEALMALTALGYSNAQAQKAVNSVKDADNMDVEDILKNALKAL